ncbi:hypothetical protein [Methylobacterium dankookense]|uniref:Outer membrane protein beta-barrel domain-containing protein n=1 Tax=Methylobacterium dankookense TaxID=560405 RepID=A0A564FTP6_9HYPH|nr:hypothetical protein [Methylobacterium dankookense]GJD56703.1 hypothetical protein IFDJLNFL_2600 [Methylobacterium dankookense]VUF11178.1 hypothetical protein MTDSW087_00853 [Methylobacterium dankookense]
MHPVATASLLSLALLAAVPARAEDFTGFYAGLNAGYAFGRGGESRRAAPGPGSATAAGRTGPDLPPSAAEAARQMRGSGRAERWALPR